ncbi:MAG: anaerobic ribonucleoside-triphosphate reductase [Culicoidibacterales bacterium]
MKVIKRDGEIVGFAIGFIERAVQKAAHEVGVNDVDFSREIANTVYESIRSRSIVRIEEIQTIVEDTLMNTAPKIARAYIQYRHERDIQREAGSTLNKQIEGLFNETNKDVTNENANKDSQIIPTKRDLLAGILSKHYAVNHLLPKHISKAHQDGLIHFHDLDYSPTFPMYNCMLIDLKNMLTNGFRMNNAMIESPKSIQTACAVTAQIIASVASHIYGGNTINRIDEILAPYVQMTYQKHLVNAAKYNIPNADVYAKEMTEKSVIDAIQGLEYEINTLSSSNG